jgi:hypothetical protein
MTCEEIFYVGFGEERKCGMNPPKPKYFIPANAEARNPLHWYNPESLCRSCKYVYLQEPYCKVVSKIAKEGVSFCEGYTLETKAER